jgi:outer membrane protein assembly factor BamA
MGPQYANDNAKGGNISLLGSISISGIPNIFDKKTRLDFFIDTGNIYENISDISTSDIGISAGVEYTYKTFIGEIGFNIAKVFRNTNKKEKDKTKLWSFVNK